MFNYDVVLWRIGCWLLLWVGVAAKHVSPNFEVEAPTDAIARQVATTAERCRRELAVDWLGHELPNWSGRCQVRVKVGQIGAGGATTFSFSEGEVFGWNMTVQGSLERILDSVIPHEVSHTIFACHFRRPLPRWADEGAATLAEEDSERRRQQKLAEEVLPTSRRIPLRDLLQITEYPKNMQHVLTLYAEGYSLADYLVQLRGKRRFLTFVQEAHELGWETALAQHYGEQGIDSLESKWSHWVIAGSPSLRLSDGQLLAAAKTPADLIEAKVSETNYEKPASMTASVVRSQTPDAKPEESSTTPTPATKKGRLLASSGGGGHSLTSGISAPEPRRGERSTDLNSGSNESTREIASINVTGLRQSRGSHLRNPELRRVSEPTSRRDDHEHPSPFSPVTSGF